VEILPWLPVLLAAYLLGSLPTSYWVGRALRGLDIRELGGGNPGTANAYRQLGVVVGVVVGVVDIGKGSVAVLLARSLAAPEPMVLLAGVAAVAGHAWSPFLGFQGGRGAATALGVFLVLLPRAVLPLAVLAVPALLVVRNVAIALALIFIPLAALAWYLGEPIYLIWYILGFLAWGALRHFLSGSGRRAAL